MKRVTLNYEDDAEEGARLARKGGNTYGCAVAVNTNGTELVIGFPDGTDDRTVFHVMTQMRDPDNPVIGCRVSGREAYTDQKIREFWHV